MSHWVRQLHNKNRPYCVFETHRTFVFENKKIGFFIHRLLVRRSEGQVIDSFSRRSKTCPSDLSAGPIIINSGYRNPEVNQKVGGVRSSQHILGQAADIRPRDPSQFWQLVEFLKICEQTDQLLTGSGWLHISWNPIAAPRHYIRIGYYK